MSRKHSEETRTIGRPESRNFLIAAALFALGALLYGNTLGVPWYFDDFHNIVNNPRVYDLGEAFSKVFAPRGISFLSFALNVAAGGQDVFGFHLLNLLIHFGNAVLVYLLLLELYPQERRWALAGALLFLVHPVQTQAVTYIVQRMTSLSCLFLLAAVLFFVRARRRLEQDDAFTSRKHLLLYGSSLLFGILAAFTKENTVILPLLLLLVEWFLPRARRKPVLRRIAYVVPFLSIPVLAGLAQIHGDQSTLQALTKNNIEFFVLPAGAKYSIPTLSPENLRWRYLSTEFVVFWIYLKLLVAPVGQVLDYCYPLAERFLNLRSMLAFAGMLGLGAVAIGLRKRLPGVLFGVLWFFVSLSVESTFFPLDPIYEHRLYLPMVGVAVICLELFRRIPRRAAAPLVVVGLTVFSVLTVYRNALWGEPIEFWRDNVARVEHSYRPKDNLAMEYFKAKRYDEALSLWQEAIRIHPYGYTLHENMGELYREIGMTEAAKRSFETAIRYSLKPATLYSKLGVLYATTGDVAGGIHYLERAVELQPNDASLVMNLGSGYYRVGRLREAIEVYRRALALEPRFFKAHLGLGYIFYELGRLDDAFRELEAARALSGRDAGVLHYYALVAHKIGREAQAREAMDILSKIDNNSYLQLLSQLQVSPQPTGGQPQF